MSVTLDVSKGEEKPREEKPREESPEQLRNMQDMSVTLDVSKWVRSREEK